MILIDEVEVQHLKDCLLMEQEEKIDINKLGFDFRL